MKDFRTFNEIDPLLVHYPYFGLNLSVFSNAKRNKHLCGILFSRTFEMRPSIHGYTTIRALPKNSGPEGNTETHKAR